MISTINRTIKFNFKTVKVNSDAQQQLFALVESEKLKADDIEEVKDGDVVVGYKRKPYSWETQVPVMAEVVADNALSDKAVATLQVLVEKRIEAVNKPAVDNAEFDKLMNWQDSLAEEIGQRKASVKVTTDMVKAVSSKWAEFLESSTTTKPQAIKLIIDNANKKFSVSALAAIADDAIIERIQALLERFIESLEDSEVMEHEPVLELWAGELEKRLNPAETEVDLDMFG